MDFVTSFGSRQKKIHLTTQRKLKVLFALNSKALKSASKNVDCEQQDISKHGKQFMGFLQCEQFHAERLRELKKVLMHPILRETVESVDDMMKLVEEMLSIHCTVCTRLLSSASDSLEVLCSCLDVYVSYSLLMDLEKTNFQKISDKCKGDFFDKELLQEPVLYISKCKDVLEKLHLAEPKEMYYNALKEVEMAWNKMQSRWFVHENTMKMLQIQRRLIRREPKILSPSRVFVREGILYKVNQKGTKMTPRTFFLFNDALLCCKNRLKTFKGDEKESLLFSALLPLKTCVVVLIMGSSDRGTLFKLTCGTLSYLLISKIPGEALSWFEELQSAIRSSQRLHGELKLKLNRRRKVLKQPTSPFLKQPP